MEVLSWIFVLILSLAILIKASDYFIDGAERLGLHFNIPPFIIGVFVLGFGTSLPELVVAIISVFQKTPEIIVGNVLGSNITNILLVLGVSAIIVKKSKINFNFLEFDIPLFITSAFLFTVTIWDGVFNFTDGLFFLIILLIYIIYTATNHRKKKRLVPEKLKEIEKEKPEKIPKTFRHNLKALSVKTYKAVKKAKDINWLTITKLFISPIFIYLGAEYVVEAVLNLSQSLNLGEDIIAASVIALGTSLPELSVSFIALKKKKIDEMLGNVIGSNIFNILLVMGVSSLISPITVSQTMLNVAVPIMIGATMIAFAIIYDKEITRWEGIILIIFYIFYLGSIFGLL